MKFDIMTLFPDMVDRILSESVIGRARQTGTFEVACHNIRSYSQNKHHNVDDTPYGGGYGMLMAAPPIYDCYRAIVKDAPENEKRRVIYLSPKGRQLTQEIATELASYDRIVLLCGHYEGVDQRVLDEIVDEDVSIGDYVLTGGELPACILVDAVARLLPGVLASPLCHEEESIAGGLLEYPQYTRPYVFLDREVPEILISGNHAAIAKWRQEQSLKITKARRPDLYDAYMEAHPPKPPKKSRNRHIKAPAPSLEASKDEQEDCHNH